MKHISTAGRYYLALCLAASGYFCTAAVKSWPGMDLLDVGSGSSYSSGGRSFGGFGGGGK